MSIKPNGAPEPHKTIMTLNEFAEYIGISRRTCNRLVASGAIPVLRFRRVIRVPVAQAILAMTTSEDHPTT